MYRHSLQKQPIMITKPRGLANTFSLLHLSVMAVLKSTGSVQSPKEKRSFPTPSPRQAYNIRRARVTHLLYPKKTSLADLWSDIVSSSWLNILLVFIPASWALNYVFQDQHTLVFVFSFLAIIPLAHLLAVATEEISMRVGQNLAGLFNATLGNTVELIVAIIALAKGQLLIVKFSLIGLILSNLPPILGTGFMIGIIAVLLPAAFHLSVSGNTPNVPPEGHISSANKGAAVLKVCDVAVAVLILYGLYLVFQLHSHHTLFHDSGEFVTNPTKPKSGQNNAKDVELSPLMGSNTMADGTFVGENDAETESDDKEVQMSLWTSLALLAVVIVLVAITAERLVDSIKDLTESKNIGKAYVGLILLPIVGNAAEHMTAVTMAVKDTLTLGLGVAVGSCLQIALAFIPLVNNVVLSNGLQTILMCTSCPFSTQLVNLIHAATSRRRLTLPAGHLFLVSMISTFTGHALAMDPASMDLNPDSHGLHMQFVFQSIMLIIAFVIIAIIAAILASRFSRHTNISPPPTATTNSLVVPPPTYPPMSYLGRHDSITPTPVLHMLNFFTTFPGEARMRAVYATPLPARDWSRPELLFAALSSLLTFIGLVIAGLSLRYSQRAASNV